MISFRKIIGASDDVSDYYYELTADKDGHAYQRSTQTDYYHVEDRLMWNVIGAPCPNLTVSGIHHGSPADRDVFHSCFQGVINAPSGWGGHVTENGRAAFSTTTENKDRVSAFDLTFAPPKSVSALWAAAEIYSDQQLASTIRQINREAAVAALEHLNTIGGLEIRLGKGGMNRRGPDSVLSATVEHVSSREGDPQLHVHGVVFNTGFYQDSDGKMKSAALDSKSILENRKAAMEFHHSYVADKLRLIGCEIALTKDGFEIEGVSQDLCDNLSNRRQDVLERAKLLGYVDNVPHAVKDRLMLEMRKAKEVEDPAQSIDQWSASFSASGVEPGEVIDVSIKEFGKAVYLDQSKRDEVIAGIFSEALEKIEQRHAYSSEIDVRSTVYSAARCKLHADELSSVFEAFVQKHMIKIETPDARQARNSRDQILYTTPALLAAEKRVLVNAVDRKNERPFIDNAEKHISDAVRSAAKRGVDLSEEQIRALRVATSDSGVSAIEGSAGAGKSTVMNGVRDIYEKQGYRTIGTAPSWKAAQGLKDSAGLSESMAIQKLAIALETGKMEMTDKSLLIVDEAGMCGTKQLDIVLSSARAAGAKVILTGDTKQLTSVEAGSPFEAIIGHLDPDSVNRIAEVRRHSIDWQRQATKDMSAGEMGKALEAYDAAGRFEWHGDIQTAKDAVVSDFRKALSSGQDFLALATTNSDVLSLNEMLRKEWRSAGRLNGEDVMIDVQTRDGKHRQIPIAVGDKLIAGEKLKLKTGEIYRSEILQIVGVRGAGKDTTVSFTIEGKGNFEATLKELSGYQATGATKKLPNLQHAYALTIYASQGVTVGGQAKNGFVSVLNAGRFSSAGALVALSRHTADVRMHIDGMRVQSDIIDKKISQGIPLLAATANDIEMKNQLFTEMSGPSANKNVIDLIGHQHVDSFVMTARAEFSKDFFVDQDQAEKERGSRSFDAVIERVKDIAKRSLEMGRSNLERLQALVGPARPFEEKNKSLSAEKHI